MTWEGRRAATSASLKYLQTLEASHRMGRLAVDQLLAATLWRDVSTRDPSCTLLFGDTQRPHPQPLIELIVKAIALRRYASNSDMGVQLHTKLRSPYALSMRPTEGQNFASRSHGTGQAARCLP